MRRYLTPRLLGAHVAVLICVLAAGGLGLWQLDAWHSRREAQSLDLTHRAPVPLDSVMGHDDPFPAQQLGAPMLVRGTWVPDATVFVSGKEHDGSAGYWVVTPLSDGGSDAPAIPVVRGWTPDPAQAPAPPIGTAVVVGWLQPSDSTDAFDDDPTDDIVPDLQVADLVQRVHQDLYSGYLVEATAGQTGPWPEGATAVNDGRSGLEAADLSQLPAAGIFTAVRNLFYAIEWWFFGAFAVFVWWKFVRDESQREELPPPDDGGDPTPPEQPQAPEAPQGTEEHPSKVGA